MKKSPKVAKISSRKLIFLIFILLIIVLAVPAIYFGNEYRMKQELAKNPTKAKEQEVEDIVAKVGKLIKLPNEVPSVATVSDITKLQGQTLFQNAQNGDKVLIFSKAKRAIVYRPAENLIVEIGNVVVAPEEASAQNQAPAQNSETVKVEIYNATSTAGHAKKIGNDLIGKYPNIELSGTGNAAGTYDKNIVYVVSDSGNKTLAEFSKNIASAIDGEVSSKLPSSENKPTDADILIILGK